MNQLSSAEVAQPAAEQITSDALWYKDAVIYQLHVKTFFDSNNDGFGDFHGLMSKLDYIQDLGVSAIWLQPFYPSPLRDDGYDVSDYHNVHPQYGTIADFKAFVREAQRRGLKVITELGLGPGGQGLLLAPLLQPPARSQLRQPARAEGGVPHHEVLARHGRRRVPPGRDSLPDRARGHDQREPARDARGAEEDPQPHRRELSEQAAARRSEHVARGRAAVLRRVRRVPHGVPLPADAAHVHGDRAGGPPPAGRDHAADPGGPAAVPVGDFPAQPRRAHARDGDKPRARLHVPDVRDRPAGAYQPRDPAAPRAAHGERPGADQADEQSAALDARLADRVLRRRDRHGRQHLSGRPQRRAYPHAVEPGPQRRLLACRSAAVVPAADHGPGVRLRSGQRRGAAARSELAVELDEAHARHAQDEPGVRARQAVFPAAGEQKGLGLSKRIW